MLRDHVWFLPPVSMPFTSVSETDLSTCLAASFAASTADLPDERSGAEEACLPGDCLTEHGGLCGCDSW